jgi:hypothetical protein
MERMGVGMCARDAYCAPFYVWCYDTWRCVVDEGLKIFYFSFKLRGRNGSVEEDGMRRQ